jgi:hypothetical protein
VQVLCGVNRQRAIYLRGLAGVNDWRGFVLMRQRKGAQPVKFLDADGRTPENRGRTIPEGLQTFWWKEPA